MPLTLDQLQLFTGATTDASAQVYARAPLVAPQAGCELSGRIHGPFCKYSTTLSASFELRDQGAGPSVLAKGTVADPCGWTPDLPFLYTVDFEWRTPSGAARIGSKRLAIRRFGARGKSWFLEGQRWVIRGAAQELAPSDSLEAWHETCPVCFVDGLPTDAFLEQAAEAGAMIVPSLRAEQIAELDRLARQATVAACVLETSPDWPADLRRRIPQTLFWEALPIEAPRTLSAWAQGAFVSLGEDPAAIAPWRELAAPVVACRRIAGAPSLAAARAECDRLQRDLAPYGDWAGYVIM